jgi:hypothetical protein
MLFICVLLYFALAATSASISNPGAKSGYVPSDARVVVTGGTNQDHRDTSYLGPKEPIVIAYGTRYPPAKEPIVIADGTRKPSIGQVYDLAFL